MKLFKLSLITLSVISLAACDLEGDDGVNGTDAINGLTKQTTLMTSNENCPNGGVRIDSGQDTNGNNKLDDSEIQSTNYVCEPGNTAINSGEILNNLNNSWYVQAQQVSEQNKEAWLEATVKEARGQAKNVILFVGDGMGVSTVTAARILDGQRRGLMGEENELSFDHFPFSGLSKTYNVDAQTPDSAGTMTAMMSGVKTDVGVIGVDETVQRGDCSTAQGNELVTALELAEIAGKSTGIISTARITHATPAATFAKSADRNWEDISDMPQEAINSGCKDIAEQLVNFEANLESRFSGLDVDGIEVVMGGGRRHFLPKDPAFNSPDAASSVEGDRTDGRDLTTEWQTQYPTGIYIYDSIGFDSITDSTERVFALFNESHMQYEADRSNDIAGEPSLTEMTEKAIAVLNKNPRGFFLSVESGRIDHAHHAGNAYGALNDTIEFARAIAKADEMTNDDDTLIIVTADHGHVFTIAGYPKRGNPILGKVVNVGADAPAEAADGMPYTTLGYTNGRGFMDLGSETNSDASYGMPISAGRKDLNSIDTTQPGYHQEALVPLSSETHSGEDVGIYAKGPAAFMVNGTNEQSIIFHIMNYASDLAEQAENRLN
ncbi:alkaline phosphatase [Idiomarina sp. PL1-037]|uniref:alkaline phosphatase n=1 Tax=Idiomarina sp. PL1-037 TaxID=3095365 RepID=UPI002ACBFE8D|nr:alkaline phosphatase [Idiomarina sp. PL1-037]WQC52076.1 alkaline phosphatase [Idiomarina sp. PL1-037]